jgi:pimeloyl-ACP methyl ester carboxylesterase
MKRKLLFLVAGLIALLLLAAWSLSGPAVPDVRAIKGAERKPGAVIDVEHLKGHHELVLRALLWWADLPVKTPITDGVQMFRVRYWSAFDSQLVEASGLMSLPFSTLRGQAPRGTVIYLHGTSPSRADSPSALGVEGMLPSAIFGGGGYTMLAPDYIGLGQSKAAQTYLHTQATVAAARDLALASQEVARALKLPSSNDLYLTGFSQGGHATAAVQRALEAAPVMQSSVKAAAAVAGAFDLANISVPYAFKHQHALYLGYLAHSYAVQYKQPLASLLVPQYASTVPTLYDGDHSTDAIQAGLPKDARDLFLPERLAEMDAGQANWFVTALVANEAFRWAPKAPLRLYFGERDTDVSPEDSKNFFAVASKLGGNISLVPVGPHTHSETAYRGVPMARLWFDELSAATRPRAP